MADERIIVSVTLDDGTVRQGFANIQRAGEATSRSLNSSFGSVTKTIAGIAAAYLSIRAIKGVFSTALEEAQNQEVAVNKLNTSLRLAGTFSREASLSFQEFASELQRTTVLGDDAVLSYAALARNFTNTNEQAKELTKAAIDLSAAVGIDTESAIRTLGGSLSGIAGQLARVLPAARGFTEEQLRAGAAIDLVSKRFAGAAAGEILTFSGQLQQLKNLSGDLLEEFGLLITKSPAIVAVFKVVSESIARAIDNIARVGKQGDPLKGLILSFIQFGQVINQFVLVPIELGLNVARAAINGIALAVQGLVTGIVTAASAIVSAISPDSALAQSLNTLKESTQLAFGDIAVSAADAGGKITSSFTVTDTVGKFLEDLNVAVEASKESFSAIGNQAQQTAVTTKQSILDLSDSIKTFVKRTAAEALPALFTAVFKGQNAFKAFGSAIFGILGDIAIQTGATLLLVGTGIEAVRASIVGLTGGPAIAAGIALIAFGSLLKTLSGGAGEAAGAGAGGGGGGVVSTTDSQISPEDNIQDAQKSQIVVNVQGDVLDSRESGLRIVELINDAFDTQGAVVRATV